MLLFHHDNRQFEQGDIIVGNHYDIRNRILDTYQSDELFSNMEDVLYMTNRVRDTWDYDNVYQVSPQGRVVKCHTNYSIIICQEEIERCMSYFKYCKFHTDWSDDSIESKYIDLMYNAYLGNSSAAQELNDLFGYDSEGFEEYEWICQSAIVSHSYIDYHECIDSVVQASIMNPLFNALYDVKNLERERTSSGMLFSWHDAMYNEILNLFNF